MFLAADAPPPPTPHTGGLLDTLKSWTVLESVLSVAGFAVAAALSLVVQRGGSAGEGAGRPLPRPSRVGVC